MTFINYINASLEIWGCLLCVLVAVCIVLSRKKIDDCDRLYFWILGCNAAVLIFDTAALFFRGHPGPVCWWGVRLSNFIAFSMGYCLLESFTHYLTTYIGRRTHVSRYPLKIVRVVCLLSLLLIVATQFYPIVYRIDDKNVYHRADLFWLSQIAGLIGMVINGFVLVRYRRAIEASEKAALWSYIILPALSMIVQIYIYGLALLNLADTVAIIVIFLFLQAEAGRRAAERENLLMQERVSIMLSQIQPHFLYNALSVIQDLCHGKAPEAEQAAVEFSEFLRGNLDSLQADSPIPFEQELRHTKNYLSLEEKRFGERLCVEYDLAATDFCVPALTLQPIVENAVRYGVMKKTAGGTVRIVTRETENAFTIAVTDDGVGFDPMLPKDDGRTHIGISNVKERLRIMCGGDLLMESTPGKGSVAIITVPKETKK